MKRRALSFLLALAMIVSLVSTNNIRAFADEGTVVESSIVEDSQAGDTVTDDATAEDPDAAGPEEAAASEDEISEDEDADTPADEDLPPAEDVGDDAAEDETVIEDSSTDAEEAAETDEDAAAEGAAETDEETAEEAQPEEAADETEAEEPAAEISDADDEAEAVVEETEKAKTEDAVAEEKEDEKSDKKSAKKAEEEIEEDEEEVELLPAAAKAAGVSVLAFTSDVHNAYKGSDAWSGVTRDEDNISAARLGTWINKVESEEGDIDVMAFGGDMANASETASNFWKLTQNDVDVLADYGVTGVFTTGNHEHSPGKYDGSDSTQQLYKINSEGAVGSNYRIYCLGSVSSSQSYSTQSTSLTEYLNNAGNDKPIFIITHFPLHTYGSRSTTGSGDIVDVLNNAVEKNHQTIVFLWGHNHTDSDTYYDQIFGPETTLPTKDGNKTIQFYYGAAGCMSDSEYGTGSHSVNGKGLVVTITPNRGSATMEFTYYDANGNEIQDTGVKSADITVKSTTTYVPATTLEDGKNYIITDGNSGEVNVVSTTATNAGTDNAGLAGIKTTVSNDTITLSEDDAAAVFTCELKDSTSGSVSAWLKNGDNYLYTASSKGLRISNEQTTNSGSTNNTGKFWHYNSDDNLLWYFKDESNNDGYTDTTSSSYKYWLEYNTEGDVVFTSNHTTTQNKVMSSFNPPNIYLFVEQTGEAVNVTGVTLDETATVQVDKTIKLTATVSPENATNKKVTWESNAPEVAAVSSNGTVTGVSVGTATITVTTVDGEFTDTCTVSVTENTSPKYVLVDSIKDNRDYLVVSANTAGSTAYALKNPGITSGNYVSLQSTSAATGVSIGGASPVYIRTDDTTIVWHATANSGGTGFYLSNDENYLRYSSNTLGAYSSNTTSEYWTYTGSNNHLTYSNGSRNLRYSSSNGYFQTSSSDYKVYIFEKVVQEVPATAITLNKNTLDLEEGKTETLTATLTPADATTSVTWATSDNTVATVANGVVTAVGAGTATITASAGEGVSAICTVTVTEPEPTRYIEVNEFKENKNYIIAVTKDNNTVYTLKNTDGTLGSAELTIITEGSNKFVETGNASLPWTYTYSSSKYRLSNASRYLTINSSSKALETDTSGNYNLTYSPDKNIIFNYPNSTSGNVYYMACTNGTFAATAANAINNAATIRIFEEYTGPVSVTGVSLNKTTLNLLVGDTETLTVTVAPNDATNKTVTWNSSDPTVATVENGVVTAVAAGTATITVTTEDQGKTATCTVTVTAPILTRYIEVNAFKENKNYIIAVTKDDNTVYTLKNTDGTLGSAELTIITEGSNKFVETGNASLPWTYTYSSSKYRLSNASRYLTINSNSKALETDTSGSYNLTYNSDKQIAMNYPNSSSGNVYYVACTNGTFAATAANASSNAATIRIFEEYTGPVAVTGVTLAPETLTLNTGETSTLTATIEPTDATNQNVSWSTSNEDVATVKNGVVTAVGNGTATITVTTEEGNKTATCAVTVTTPVMVDYILTDTLEAGNEYLIATKNNGSGFILSKEAGSVSNSLKGYVVDVIDDKITITEATATKTAFTCVQNSNSTDPNYVRLTNGGKYLYADNSGALRLADSISDNDKNWHYRAGKYVLWFYKGSGGDYGYTATDVQKYYLQYDANGNFTKGTVTNTSTVSGTNTPSIYLFVKDDGLPYYDVTLPEEGFTGTDKVKQGKTYTFTKSADADEYNYGEVTYTMGGGASTTITPDSDGVYTIANVTGDLVISGTRTPKPATTYVLTDTLKAGDKFIIASSDTAGSAKLLCRDDETANSADVTVVEADGKKTITTSKVSAVLEATTNSTGFTFKNGDYYFTLEYLQGGTNSSKLQFSTDASTKYWLYSGYQLTCSSSSSPRYLYYSGSNSAFVANTSGSGRYAYVYVEKSDAHEHTYGTPTYTWADDNSTCTATVVCEDCDTSEEGHEVTETVNASYDITTAATCTAVGSGKYTATFENELFTQQTKVVEIPKIAHELEHHDAAAATCTAAGNIEYWQCSVCNKYFSDAQGANEISQADTVDPIKTHNLDHHDAVAATCTAAGNIEYWQCSVCEQYFSDAAGANEITQAQTVIPIVAHTLEHHDAVAATCTKAGNIEYWQCSVCEQYFSDEAGTTEITQAETVDPMIAHNLEHHDAVAATCTKAGNIEYWQCSVCEQYFSDAAGANEITQAQTVVAIDPNAHSWKLDEKDVTWSWTGVTSATATFTCENDSSHTHPETAAITSAQGTGEDVGYTVYTATVTFQNHTYTSTERTINQYTLTFKDGDTVIKEVTKDYGAAITDEDIPAPTKSFYTFDGWDPEVPAAMPAENKTFTAQWTAVEAYYLIGSITNGQVVENYALTAMAGSEDEYSIGTTLAVGDEIRVVRAVGGVADTDNYYPSEQHGAYGKTDSYIVDADHAGSVTLEFEPGGNANSYWRQFGGYFYIKKDHTITVETYEHGSAIVKREDQNEPATSAPTYKLLTVECTPDYNYQLDRIELWKTNGGTAAEQTLEMNEFHMPDYDLTVKVYFKQIAWTFTGFTWTGSDEAGWTAVANYSGSDGSTKTVDATVTTVTTDPSCNEAGSTVYTATVTASQSLDGNPHDENKSVAIGAIGHNYGELVFNWVEVKEGDVVTGYTCATATATCTQCEEGTTGHVVTVNVTLTHKTTTAPGCETTGVETYTATCTYNNQERTDEKTVTIAATGHAYGEPEWTWAEDHSKATATFTCSKCGDIQDVEDTKPARTEVSAASCTADQVVKYSAKVTFNGTEYPTETENITVEGTMTAHTYGAPTWTWADDHSSATATFKCSACNDTKTETDSKPAMTEVTAASCTANQVVKYSAKVTFNGTEYPTETENITVEGTMTAHTYGAPTWTWADDHSSATATFKCSACNDTKTETDSKPAMTEVTAASCTANQVVKYSAKVTLNGTEYPAETENITVEGTMTAHTYGAPTWTWAEDHSSATATFKCSACNDTKTETDSKPVMTEVTAASCTANQVVKYSAKVTFNGTEYPTETENITVEGTMTGHSYGEPEWTWAEDYSKATAKFTCTKCGAVQNIEDTELDETVVTFASCTVDKVVKYTASVELAGQTYSKTSDNVTITGSATGHAYGAPVWTWAEDYSKATAKFTCSKCEDIQLVEDNQPVENEISAATCTDNKVVTYTAKITFKETEYTETTDNVTLEGTAKGHAYGAPTYTWAADNKSVTAERICANDTTHVETETADATYSVTTPAKCEEAGVGTWTSADFTNTAFVKQSKEVEIAALTHAWGAVTYTWSGDNTEVTATRICGNDETHIQTETASATYEVITPATETTPGTGRWTSAAFENEAFAVTTKDVEIPPTGYKVEYEWVKTEEGGYSVTGTATPYNTALQPITETVDATYEETLAATCSTEGAGVWTATFTKEQLSAQTREVTVAALGHKWGEVTYTWSADNTQVSALRTCENNTNHVEAETVAATGEKTKDPTCDEAGVMTYTSAEYNNKAFEAQTKEVAIPALGHAWKFVDFTWIGNDADGYTAAVANYECETDKTHTTTAEAQIVKTTTDASCTVAGTVVYTASVSAADSPDETARSDSKTVTGAALGHDYEFTGWTWATDYSTAIATFTCKNNTNHIETAEGTITTETTPAECGKAGKIVYTASLTFEDKPYTDEKEAEIAALDHEWGDWVETIAATCEKAGEKTHTCGRCGATETEVIPAKNHSYGEATYVWADNNTSVTATRVCANDASHIETETAEATYTVTKPATETEAGIGTWTSAAFTNEAFTVQTKEVSIPPTGYEVSYEWTKTADGYSVKGTAVPKNSALETVTETVTATYGITTEATCTTDGVGTWTATFTKEQFSTQTKDEPIAAAHELKKTAAKAATCTEAGNSAYWSCEKCGKFFSDENGTNEITEGSWIVEALGHSWGAWIVTKEATCTKAGEQTRTCSRCGETEKKTIPATGHSLKKTAAKAATCTEDGNTAYWTCSNCGKYFSDSQGKTEIEKNSWVIEATGHSWSKPTWKWTGSAAKGYTKATATFTCENDDTHTSTKKGTIEITSTAGTATKAGKVIYTATVKGPDGKTYTAKKTVTFSDVLMNAVTAKGTTSLIIKWTKISNVEGYDIFLGQCNSKTKKNAYKKVHTVEGNSKFSWTATGLVTKKSYKVQVKAYVTVNGKKVYVRRGDTAHVYTAGGTKTLTNPKAVVLKNPSGGTLSLAVGKTYTIKASLTKAISGNKITESHAPFYRYISSKTSVATVSSSGKITAKKAGTCKIYVYSINGVYKVITVTVK